MYTIQLSAKMNSLDSLNTLIFISHNKLRILIKEYKELENDTISNEEVVRLKNKCCNVLNRTIDELAEHIVGDVLNRTVEKLELNSLIKQYTDLDESAIDLKKKCYYILGRAIDTLSSYLDSVIVEEHKTKIRKINDTFYVAHMILRRDETRETLLYECDETGKFIYGGNCDYYLFCLLNDERTSDETIAERIRKFDRINSTQESVGST